MRESETIGGPSSPTRSPTYPRRVHAADRPALRALFQTWEERVAAAGQERVRMADRAGADLLYVQMQGARDQIAEVVRRLPMEVGNLYEEDRLRLEEAVAALERLTQRWAAMKSSGPA